MKKKIEKYLYSKKKASYTEFDKILEMNLNGMLKNILSIYDGVRIYPSFSNEAKSIQIVYNYHNIYVTIDFFEDKYNLVIYNGGIELDELEKLFTDYGYSDSFNFKRLIDEIDIKIKNHPQLTDTSSIKKKAKIYSIISFICLFLPSAGWGCVGLYCIFTDSSIKVNEWYVIIFLIVPLILYLVFNLKSQRLKQNKHKEKRRK